MSNDLQLFIVPKQKPHFFPHCDRKGSFLIMPCSPFARNTPIDVNEIYARGSHAESGPFCLVVFYIM